MGFVTNERNGGAKKVLVLGAIFLFFLAGPVQRSASAQSGNTAAPRAPGQNPNGMHIYLWAGLKSHLPGQHDYPQFLADWSKLLTEHGAVVDGALHPPTGADLEHTDVVVIYKGDAGYPRQRKVCHRSVRQARRWPREFS